MVMLAGEKGVSLLDCIPLPAQETPPVSPLLGPPGLWSVVGRALILSHMGGRRTEGVN